MKAVSFRCSTDLWEKFKHKVQVCGTDGSSELRLFIEQYIKTGGINYCVIDKTINKQKTIHFRCPTDLWEKFKIKAGICGTDPSVELRLFMQKYIKTKTSFNNKKEMISFFNFSIKEQKNIVKNLILKTQFDKTTDCQNWLGAMRNGYGVIFVKYQTCAVHRMSYEIFNNCKATPGLIILHSCDNPQCVNPAHLSEGTPAQNTKDMINKGRSKFRGLNEVQVLEIKQALTSSKLTQAEIAKKHNVNVKTVRRIKNNKS